MSNTDYGFLRHISYIDCTRVTQLDETEVINQLEVETERIKGRLLNQEIAQIRKAVSDNKGLELRYQKLILASLI